MEPAGEDLVGRAIALARAVRDAGDYEPVWEILREVAADGPASLLAGTDLLPSRDPVVRSVGCDLLGCAAERHEEVRTDAASALLRIAPSETDADVNWSIARALGGTRDQRAVPVLVSLAAHPDSDVRLQAAQALLPHLAGYDAASPPVATALRECDPAARRQRDEFAAALLHAVYDRSPAAAAAVFSTLLETGLTLRTSGAEGTLTWSVEGLMERAGGDVRRAADVVARESTRPSARVACAPAE